MSRTIRAAICFAMLLACTARADVVVPNSAAATEADGTFALTTTGATGRTYQFTIDSGQLAGLVGQQILCSDCAPAEFTATHHPHLPAHPHLRGTRADARL